MEYMERAAVFFLQLMEKDLSGKHVSAFEALLDDQRLFFLVSVRKSLSNSHHKNGKIYHALFIISTDDDYSLNFYQIKTDPNVTGVIVGCKGHPWVSRSIQGRYESTNL